MLKKKIKVNEVFNMERASVFLIWKKDIGETLQIKRIGKIIEYWHYIGKETNLLLPSGRKWLDESEKHLDSIIACSLENNIFADTKDYIKVVGVKFTGHDMQEYLHRREELRNNKNG